MTVKELIAKLQAMPQDMEVVTQAPDFSIPTNSYGHGKKNEIRKLSIDNGKIVIAGK